MVMREFLFPMDTSRKSYSFSIFAITSIYELSGENFAMLLLMPRWENFFV